jgi:hypothetical protein
VRKVAVVIFCMLLAAGSAYGMDMSKHIGFSVWGGGFMPVSGKYNSEDKLSDWFGLYGFPAAELKYLITDKVALGVNAGYGYSPIKEGKKKELGAELEDQTPALNIPWVSLNGTFNFSPMIKSANNMLNPFVTIGVGTYSWYFAKNERTDKLPAPADTTQQFKATSWGVNFGGGAEYFVTAKLAAFARFGYHLVMMKDEKKFGEDFGNQGFLTFGAGVTLYLFTGKH